MNIAEVRRLLEQRKRRAMEDLARSMDRVEAGRAKHDEQVARGLPAEPLYSFAEAAIMWGDPRFRVEYRMPPPWLPSFKGVHVLWDRHLDYLRDDPGVGERSKPHRGGDAGTCARMKSAR